MAADRDRGAGGRLRRLMLVGAVLDGPLPPVPSRSRWLKPLPSLSAISAGPMLNDLFRWLRDAILESIGRLIVSVFSLGLVRIQRDEGEITFPLYGVVRDTDGRYVASSGIAKLIGALVFAPAFIATFMLLSDIPL